MLITLGFDFLDTLELLFFLYPFFIGRLRKPFLTRMMILTERLLLSNLGRHRTPRVLLLIISLVKLLNHLIYCPIEVLTLQSSGLMILCNTLRALSLQWLGDILVTPFFVILWLSSVPFIAREVYSCSIMSISVSEPLVYDNLAVANFLHMIVY